MIAGKIFCDFFLEEIAITQSFEGLSDRDAFNTHDHSSAKFF